MSDIEDRRGTDTPIAITNKDVVTVIKNMTRGKSPGHDGLSIEHLLHAGPHLPRVLTMLYNFCIRHSYLPEELLRTIVVPIIKNKTGDAADKTNYRPISLATIVAKVLDGLLERQLSKHLNLNDAQFGFRPQLSTESAILTLKQTIRYYTDRKTPVYAAFLDLTKAFDLVSYEKLWYKLQSTGLPDELISIFKFWYINQTNYVRWADSLSDMYGLECGVRQGGLTSPTLFNIYVDQLIGELGSTMVGCSIDGTMVNNISYADDMVLLSPSVSALRKLLRVCEEYAESHGLVYNVRKSELMVFRASRKIPSCVPPMTLAGVALKRVTHFKYLGHIVEEDLKDDMDMERERRALSVRCNMLARRFARCTKEVKITLFKAYCQSFYTCGLWVNYTQKAYNALRVQYNNGFRMLLGLPRHCSASGMFAEACISDFYGIVRQKTASLMRRCRGGTNGILKIMQNRVDSSILKHWVAVHLSFNNSSMKMLNKFRLPY